MSKTTSARTNSSNVKSGSYFAVLLSKNFVGLGLLSSSESLKIFNFSTGILSSAAKSLQLDPPMASFNGDPKADKRLPESHDDENKPNECTTATIKDTCINVLQDNGAIMKLHIFVIQSCIDWLMIVQGLCFSAGFAPTSSVKSLSVSSQVTNLWGICSTCPSPFVSSTSACIVPVLTVPSVVFKQLSFVTDVALTSFTSPGTPHKEGTTEIFFSKFQKFAGHASLNFIPIQRIRKEVTPFQAHLKLFYLENAIHEDASKQSSRVRRSCQPSPHTPTPTSSIFARKFCHKTLFRSQIVVTQHDTWGHNEIRAFPSPRRRKPLVTNNTAASPCSKSLTLGKLFFDATNSKLNLVHGDIATQFTSNKDFTNQQDLTGLTCLSFEDSGQVEA
ncbi:hypothetical protein P5673_008959 [Acropora cervicornis]|uniref:Uncharacterized protein n=1 Tax=Acropora cervicornis TaxID=6130 RepID=A0AAD9VAU0_ACRCE|nr:hypothetical protein P5673_008959 [Acropora cervicornis]